MRILMISRATLRSSPGGDTTQILETFEHLKKLGVEVDIVLTDQKTKYDNYDLIHFFNIIRPSDILVHIRKSKLPYVVSTIFVDYSEADINSKGVFFRVLNSVFGSDAIEYLKVLARAFLNGERINSLEYLILGHSKCIRKIIRNARVLLPNSESEYKRLVAKYREKQNYVVIPNAINPAIFKFNQNYERSGVLCVARIEPLKNQLNLIRAMVGLPFHLTIIGTYSLNHKAYYDQCTREAGANVSFKGQLSQGELFTMYSKAKVHVLPSWFETTGLSSLEAAVCGCNIVVTRKGDTEDYFGHYAYYCLPDDVQSIKEALAKAYETSFDVEFSEIIRNHYNWDETARKTLEAYNTALKI